MKIYIVRHGETFFNTKHRVQGWCDSPLTETGIHQAENVGRHLMEVPFEKAYCSTQERVVDTAHYIIGQRAIELEERKELKEINFGIFEADFEKDVFPSHPHQEGFVAYGGESLEMVVERVMGYLKVIAQNHEGNVLVVTHGGSIMNTINAIDEGRVERERKAGHNMENCSVTILNVENGNFSIEDYANCSYREEIK